ncbi:MAG: family 20 glycosylhydrolase [Acidobacteriota bacterium]
MKHRLFAAAFCLLFASCGIAQNNGINIVPKPQSVLRGVGEFRMTKDTRIVFLRQIDQGMASLLKDQIKSSVGLDLKIERKIHKGSNSIVISTNDSRLVSEIRGDYTVDVDKDRADLYASFPTGLFYAIQSFRQMLPVTTAKSASIPVVKIEDFPRFPYRGMHLDVGRHFMPVEFVKKYIDLMSQYKLNYFHWHLTEDQGWRIEIKKYPKLTEIGSHRPETVKEKNLNPYIGDGTPEGGFYTQEQIKDVVAYAKARYITVIPEIELPGHSSAALAAYPEFGCKQDYNYKVQTTWGIFKEVYCPTEKTFSFLEDVLTEVIGLFPDSPYIHIGGDEVLKTMWSESPEVKELMARENLKDVNEVQSYFVRRMEKFINSKGKKIIGWDEILEGGLAPNATVMSWRGIKGGIEAAKSHHDVIMTPTDYVYLDYGQGDPAYEPINIGSYVPLEKVYSFDPVPPELSPDEAKYIIGGQANVWTEYMATPERVEYMAFPRMLALAEDVWSTPANKNFEDFSHRLAAQFARLDKQNVNYRIPEPTGLANGVYSRDEPISLKITAPLPESKVVYTNDGSDPVAQSLVIPSDLTIQPNGQDVVTLKTRVILPNGKMSSVYSATLLRRPWLASNELKEKRAGVTFGLSSPELKDVPPISSGETRSIGLQSLLAGRLSKTPFSVAFDGYINAPADGVYEFQIESTCDASLIIGGEKLIDIAGTKDRAMHSEVVALKAGLHKLSLRYNNRGDNPLFRIRWGIKGQGLRVINGSELVH